MKRLVDAHGRPVPKRLMDPFYARRTLEKRLRELVSWRQRLFSHENRKLEGLDYENIGKHLEIMQCIIHGSLPYTICSCNQRGKCELCGGKGWLTMHEEVTKGLRFSSDESSREQQAITMSPRELNSLKQSLKRRRCVST